MCKTRRVGRGRLGSKKRLIFGPFLDPKFSTNYYLQRSYSGTSTSCCRLGQAGFQNGNGAFQSRISTVFSTDRPLPLNWSPNGHVSGTKSTVRKPGTRRKAGRFGMASARAADREGCKCGKGRAAQAQCEKKKQPTVTGFSEMRTAPLSISTLGLSGGIFSPSIQTSGSRRTV